MHVNTFYSVGILEEMLAMKPSVYSLYDVIQRVAPCCHRIAVELGLEVHYRILETDHPNDCTLRCQKVFEKFLSGNNPTWKKVIDAIKNVGFIAVADNVEKQLPGKGVIAFGPNTELLFKLQKFWIKKK